MDPKRFLKLLKRYAWVLILVPLVAAALTYMLSKDLPKEYKSEAQIATGLVDQSKQLSTQAQSDFFKISQQFANIIEKMKMRKIMSILSYQLIIHDLENPKAAFRKYSPKIDSLSSADRQEVINEFKSKLAAGATLTILDNNGKYKLYDIVTSMGYNEVAGDKKLAIFRPENSDFINIEYTSENSLLSAFFVNTLATEFIKFYSADVFTNQNNSIAVLDSLLKRKEGVMNAKNANLKNFKMKNGVLNVSEQAATLYTQISQYEERKAQALRDIQANQGALAAINSKLSGRGGDPYLGGNAVADNRLIITLKNQLKTANDRYIDGNFKPADKRRVDSLQNLINIQDIKNSDNNVVDPQVAKQGIIQQKLNLEISTAQIKHTISSIDKEMASLKAQYSSMVPFDAGIQNFERDADVATKDYMAALDRANQSRTDQNIGLKLSIAQNGLPGIPQSSKAIIFVGLSAVATFMICFVVLIVLFLMDSAVYSTEQLSRVTGIPAIGSLNLLKGAERDPRKIWKDEGGHSDYSIYKDLVRSLRFELDKDLAESGAKILGITGLDHGEGKSFVTSSLVYAFAMTGKKVLLISSEEETKETGLSQKLIPSEFFETFLVKKEIQTEDLITVLNSKSTNTSLLETQSTEKLKNGFNVLKNEFDLILVDMNSLKEFNKAKEWLYFTDKSIAVFAYGNTINEGDRSALDYLKKQPGFMGWVMNKVKDKSAV